MLVESHYVDRQFTDEYAAYYSRCFQPIINHCSRIHIFASEITKDAFDALLSRAAADNYSDVAQELQRDYLGFVVVRPLSAAPIGRTVLQHFPETAGRRFRPTVDYGVHLAGLRLEVRGLAFQQQDRAVAACATTAVWTALQRVCRNEGVRAPTTSEITMEAVRHYVPDGRPFPSDGLRWEQMSEALRAFQFPPDLLQVHTSPRYFMAQIHVYLRSGVPVILGIETDEIGHAVAVVGCCRAEEDVEAHSIPDADGEISLAMRNLEYRQIYVHDDRLGPYARAILEPMDGEGPFEVNWGVSNREDDRRLRLRIERPADDTEEAWVKVALVPLYPKLRTSAEELIHASLQLVSFMGFVAKAMGCQLGLEVFFDRAGTYQAQLYRTGDPTGRLAKLQQSLALSRYVGVSRWYVDEMPLADVIWDTTDRIRGGASVRSVLGLVAYRKEAEEVVAYLGETFAAPTT